VCALPANAGVETVDRRVAAAWQQRVGTAGPETEVLRRAVALRWTAARRSPTAWCRLQSEADDLRARLDDADIAHYVRGDLDRRRYAMVTKRLNGLITDTEAALAEADTHVDATPLDDPAYVAEQWRLSTFDARRDLLRLAWTKIVIAKSSQPGGHFDPHRIGYVSAP